METKVSISSTVGTIKGVRTLPFAITQHNGSKLGDAWIRVPCVNYVSIVN
jgi:hypothetical protein